VKVTDREFYFHAFEPLALRTKTLEMAALSKFVQPPIYRFVTIRRALMVLEFEAWLKSRDRLLMAPDSAHWRSYRPKEKSRRLTQWLETDGTIRYSWTALLTSGLLFSDNQQSLIPHLQWLSVTRVTISGIRSFTFIQAPQAYKVRVQTRLNAAARVWNRGNLYHFN